MMVEKEQVIKAMKNRIKGLKEKRRCARDRALNNK